MPVITRRQVKAPVLPRWLRPRLDRTQRRDMATMQLSHLWDIHLGRADENTLWDMSADAFTWSYVAQQLQAGEAEMLDYLELLRDLVRHYKATGRVEFTSPEQDEAARLAAAYMEDLAEMVDLDMAVKAAAWSETTVNAIREGGGL